MLDVALIYKSLLYLASHFKEKIGSEFYRLNSRMFGVFTAGVLNLFRLTGHFGSKKSFAEQDLKNFLQR